MSVRRPQISGGKCILGPEAVLTEAGFGGVMFGGFLSFQAHRMSQHLCHGPRCSFGVFSRKPGQGHRQGQMC